MAGPSKTMQPFGIGSPRPGMRRSASMRPMSEGKTFPGMRILLRGPAPERQAFWSGAHSPSAEGLLASIDRPELSRTGQTDRPGPSDLRSDRVRGIRASSIRWDLAGLLGRGAEPVCGPVPEGPRCLGPPRTDRWPVSCRPTGTRRPPRHAPVGTLRNRGPEAAAFVPSLFPVPAEHRQLPPAQLRAPRSAPPRGREAPVGNPGVSAGPPTDDGSKARGYLLRDRGDGRERDARRLRTGAPGPSSRRVPPRPGRRRADERGRDVRAEGPSGVSHDGVQTEDQEGVRPRPTEVRANDLCRTPRRNPPGPPHRGRTEGPPRKPGGLRGDREENRSRDAGEESPRADGTRSPNGRSPHRRHPEDARGDPDVSDRT